MLCEFVTTYRDAIIARSRESSPPAVEDTLAVMADRQMLTSAAMNLLSNAFKFTPVSGRIVLRAYRRDARALSVAGGGGGTGLGLTSQQVGPIPQIAAEARVTLAPELEASGDGTEQPRRGGRRLVPGRADEEAGAKLRIPANVVPAAQLFFEEPGQHQAKNFRTCR